MTNTFIQETVETILSEHSSLLNTTIITPSQRATIFISNEIKKQRKNSFLPEFITIEEFIEQITKTKIADNLTILIDIFKWYNKEFKSKDTFDDFIKWATIMMKDLNDLDYYLVDTKDFFQYVQSIERIEKWSPNELEIEITDLIQKDFLFWEKIEKIYTIYHKKTTEKSYNYRGKLFKEATKKIDSFLSKTSKHFIFIGFNALNKAEDTIFSTCLKSNKASIFWDIDRFYFDKKNHEAGIFLRSFLKKEHYTKHKKINNHFTELHKNISIHSVNQNIDQAKTVGKILEKWNKKGYNRTDTAVVLGEENLITPILNSLPDSVEYANVTMGMPLKNIPLHHFFDAIINLYISYEKMNQKGYYHIPVLNLIENSYFKKLAPESENLAKKIIIQNKVFLTKNWLLNNKFKNPLIQSLFSENIPKSTDLLNLFIAIIVDLKSIFADEFHQEYLFKFANTFRLIQLKIEENQLDINLKSLLYFYKTIGSQQKLSFYGEPVLGLQIMGVLETRLLSFKNIILTSVNEGILPKGRKENSFIPFDVRRYYNLPTYIESDSIFAYHFYRLLQRAENIALIYNNQIDAMGSSGEKSRFIRQLEYETKHNIKYYYDDNKPVNSPIVLKAIQKSEESIKKLSALAKKGFSPSAINSYIRNPIDFYKQKILGIYEEEIIEETTNYRDFGTIIHDSLEELYTPYLKKILIEEDFKAIEKKIESVCHKNYEKIKKIKANAGESLITIAQIIKYTKDLVKYDKEEVKKGNELIILELEKNLNAPLKINDKLTINIKGFVDRIDSLNGCIRIIDYKSGYVQKANLKLNNYDILHDEKGIYILQVLLYAYMYIHQNCQSKPIPPMQSLIYSFKNAKDGMMEFNTAPKNKKDTSIVKNNLINTEVLDNLQEQIKIIITELFDIKIPFEEKEIKSY